MERINVDLSNICLNSEINIRDKSIKPKKSKKAVLSPDKYMAIK